MTSIFSLLFLAIQQRLQAIQTGSPAAAAFNFIDQDLGQLETRAPSGRYPVEWPAITIDIEDSNFTNMSANTQQGVLNVCIRIGFPAFSSTEMNVPATYKNKALYYYDLEDLVHKALQGWAPGTVTITPSPSLTTADLSNNFGHFIRTRAATENRNDGLRVRNLIYSIGIDDYSTQNLPIMTEATFTLETTLSTP